MGHRHGHECGTIYASGPLLQTAFFNVFKIVIIFKEGWVTVNCQPRGFEEAMAGFLKGIQYHCFRICLENSEATHSMYCRWEFTSARPLP